MDEPRATPTPLLAPAPVPGPAWQTPGGAARADWLELAVLLAIAPLLLFPGGWRTLALAVLPGLWLVRRVLTGRFTAHTPFDPALLALLAMVLVSLYATYSIPVSLPKIAGVVLGISVFYALAGFATTAWRYRLVLYGYLAATFALVLVGLAGTAWVSKSPAFAAITGQLPGLIRGVPGVLAGFGPAEVAGTLLWALFIPLALAGGQWREQRGRAFGLAVLGALAIGLVLLTQSRSAWLGLAAGSLVLIAALGRYGRVLAGVGLVLSLLALTVFGPRYLEVYLVLRGAETFATPPAAGGSLQQLDAADRMEIWTRAWRGIQDFPFTGIGLGTFRHVVHVLYPFSHLNADKDIAHAHNEVLQTALDLGVPGLLAFLALQLQAAYLSYRSYRSSAPQTVRLAALGVLAGLAAHATFGLTDAVALGAKPGVFFWAALGLLAAGWRWAVPGAARE